MNEAPSAARLSSRPTKILMVAGEVSGDRQAAHLARAIRARDENAILFGAGGDEMRAAGVDVVRFTTHLGCVGVWPSLRSALPLRRLFKELIELARRKRPDLVLLVDNEGFNTTLAKGLRREGIPIVFYFPPQVWLWGRWRARAIAKVCDLVLPAFPDEASVYEASGACVRWLGHPLLDTLRVSDDHRPLFTGAGLDPSLPLVAIMPGSRLHELRQFMPTMLEAVRIVQQRHPEIQVILPLAANCWGPIVEDLLGQTAMRDRITIVTEDIYTWLSRCSLVITKSGTSTLESALLGVPLVACYRVDTLTYWLGALFARTDYIAMPNILKGRRIVPELLQRQFTVENVVAESLRILEDMEYAQAMREQLSTLRSMLGTKGVIDRAAALILCRAEGKPSEQCLPASSQIAASVGSTT